MTSLKLNNSAVYEVKLEDFEAHVIPGALTSAKTLSAAVETSGSSVCNSVFILLYMYMKLQYVMS